MKKMIKYSNHFGFVLAICVMGISGCSYIAPKPTPDPLAGWHISFDQDSDKLDKAIRENYQAYIQTLTLEERKLIGIIWILEDGTGQHAIRIEIDLHGTEWEHVLIYDKSDKRIKVLKYVGGHYRS